MGHLLHMGDEEGPLLLCLRCKVNDAILQLLSIVLFSKKAEIEVYSIEVGEDMGR